MNKESLDSIYKEMLEEKIISYLAEQTKLPLRDVMDIYYRSSLAEQIDQGCYGIENMDYKYLALDLMENEPELFTR